MIIYDLKCEQGHTFEGWFQDRENWILQNSRSLVSCPVCNSTKIDIVPSSITIMGKDKDTRAENKSQSKEMSSLAALKMLQQYVNKNFEDVGDKFAEVALNMHYGNEENRNIKGTSTPEEEKNLKEEGVKFIKIPSVKLDS
ncbi:MAG: DUF1178 family protein [Smithella sp.]